MLIEEELTPEQVGRALKTIFPQLEFHYYDTTILERIDCNNIFFHDGKHITYSINKWNQKFKIKLEVHDFPKENSIERIQYIGQEFSKMFQTKVITEVLGNLVINQYRALLIDGAVKKIIDDDGIEFDNYEIKVLSDFNTDIKIFDEDGCL